MTFQGKSQNIRRRRRIESGIRTERISQQKLVPDFDELALRYHSFTTIVQRNSREKIILDFDNEETKRVLGRAILHYYFHLRTIFARGHLVPAITSRMNYIEALSQLINSYQSCLSDRPRAKQILGLDIGTGPVAIYSLLGSRMYNWRFVGLDVDPESIHYARMNVELNGMEDAIEIRQSKNTKNNIILGNIKKEEQYEFCMCNPPFFEDEQERIQSGRGRLCVGTSLESQTQGGEIVFIRKIIQESRILWNRFKWFTSLIGKKKDGIKLKQDLVEEMIRSQFKEKDIEIIIEDSNEEEDIDKEQELILLKDEIEKNGNESNEDEFVEQQQDSDIINNDNGELNDSKSESESQLVKVKEVRFFELSQGRTS
ncbi:MAG: putative S-adenosyl-L-methionine dependent methyltransferase [Streblomastix strix]|uniref:Putative S-adenosyl-L-methionine dependent methyltransferase n=1 Tax=Streblomastix strix TaxID=222440 RepID=A0A5J4WP89_9EUKA|nr:MAG: putative S-adenosyl-L-methionine dependent methyltransferase [Streblomastix strix]